ncbi:MAG TPA: carboxypeptidase-like regulatory domain-containing protein [Pyrinomonadaceae bacterium]
MRHQLTTRLKLYSCIALLIALCGAGSVRAQQTAVTISGRVSEESTGQGIDSVAVVALGNQTGTRVAITDAQGNYRLPFGANTNIKLRAYKTGFIFNPASVELISPGGQPINGARTFDFTGTRLPFPILIFALPPILLTEDESLNALALDAVLHTRDPFPLVNDHYFGADSRTRVKLFLVDLDLYSGETLSIISVQAQDEQRRAYVLPVEDLRKVPNFPWLSQLTIRLPGELAGVTDITLSVSARGQASNVTRLRLR